MNAVFSTLNAADRWLLLKVNRSWTADSLNAVMPVITDLQKVKWFAWGVAPAILALWLWKGGRKALKVLVVAALAVAAADQFAARAIKPLVSRPRPANAGVFVDLRAPEGGWYGFPSNHAANSAAAAAVLSVAYPGGAYAFAGISALIGYSRVYCGVHYPLDVIAGWALGVAIGWPWGVLMLGGGGGGASSKKKKR